MAFLTELGEILHEEHFRILVLISGLENRVSDRCQAHPLDPQDDEERQRLEELIVALDQIIDHNAFEEAVLFPLICERGGRDLTSLLTQEHVTIGPLAKKLHRLAVTILKEGITAERWAEFRGDAKNLAAEMMAHLQKEEMTVVQRLQKFLDADTDHRLALKHLAERPPARIKLAFAGASSPAADRGRAKN